MHLRMGAIEPHQPDRKSKTTNRPLPPSILFLSLTYRGVNPLLLTHYTALYIFWFVVTGGNLSRPPLSIKPASHFTTTKHSCVDNFLVYKFLFIDTPRILFFLSTLYLKH